jgi:hypothetical protein
MRHREKERECAREWRRNNPDKVQAQKAKSRAANYFRPFVAIDSEGQDYPKDDISYEGVRYWSAARPWRRRLQSGRPWDFRSGSHSQP